MCAAADGLSRKDDYGAIPWRNVFRLSPAPENPRPVAGSKPSPRILLTGVTDILGDRVALLKLEFPTKPPETPKERYLILAEGQRDADLEVVQVDVRRGAATILCAGEVTTLSLQPEVAKPAEGSPPLPQMGSPVPVHVIPR